MWNNYKKRFRQRRLQEFDKFLHEALPLLQQVRILDIGGTRHFWMELAQELSRPIRVDVLNIVPETNDDSQFPSWLEFAEIDATSDLWAQLSPTDYDVLFSNSVIEHVGGWTEMRAFASNFAKFGGPFFVQTPNFFFPLDPHSMIPGFQFLPDNLKVPLVRAKKCGHYSRATSEDEAWRIVEGTRMLSTRSLMALFPEAEIRRERLLGLTKSLVAKSSACREDDLRPPIFRDLGSNMSLQ